MKWIILFGLVAFAQSEQYSDTTSTSSSFCNMNVCDVGWEGPSSACSFTQSVSMQCSEGKTFTFNKEAVVKKHNELRQKIASGSLAGYEPAQRMAEMQYSDELAQTALYNVKKCKFEHDCGSTTSFPNAGQNLAISWPWPFGTDTIDSKISGFIDSWFNENLKCNMGEIKQLNDLMTCGHFTQVVQEKSTYVGCAAGTFLRNGNMVLYFACNYGVGNFSPSYIGGAAGSKCTTKSTNYSALCSKY